MLAALAALLLAVPTGNLVVNPGAEAAGGWSFEGNFTTMPYSDDLGFPTPAQSASWAGGANFFAGGPETPAGAATQTVDVAVAAREIDAGRVTLALSALIGGYEDQEDAATVTATSLDALGAPLAATSLASATVDDRRAQTTLLPRSATGPVPRGSRTIVVRLASTRAGGAFNDGYVDNVSLTLHLAPLQVTGSTVSGTVRVRGETLTGAAEIPLGARIDARRGVIELTTESGTARVAGGTFVLRRATVLRLAGRTTLRVEGSSRVVGRLSTTTGNGRWQVRNTRAATVTRVTSGSARVRDTAHHRTITVRAGERYRATRRR
jgi:hypothetical protein